jgi:vancomycin resistance protein YoaR
LTIAAAGVCLHSQTLPTDRALFGVLVAEGIPPEGERLGDWLERQRQKLAAREAYLELADDLVPVTQADLGIELDVADTLRRTLAHAQQGTVFERIKRARRARAGLEQIPATFVFDRARAKATLTRIAPRVRKQPVDARLDLRNHERVIERAGQRLDLDGMLSRLARVRPEPVLVVPVVIQKIAPAVTSDMIESIDVSRMLSSYETDFTGRAGRRAINIRVAADYLNGTIIAPGQAISFNKVVGPRTERRGFVEAPVIVNDEMERGLGGGVCQVASTLHAAAVYGALDVVTRRSHSRPSGYAPLGLDAVVLEDEVDLKLRNPYDTAVMVHAFLPHPHRIRVELLGRDPPGRIEHLSAIEDKVEYYRRVTTREEFAPGEVKRRQGGIFGYDVRSVVRITYPDGKRSHRAYKSKYYPVPEVYWVGAGYDLAQLPALPDGARYVEIDGVKYGQDGSRIEASDPEASAATGVGVDQSAGSATRWQTEN